MATNRRQHDGGVFLQQSEKEINEIPLTSLKPHTSRPQSPGLFVLKWILKNVLFYAVAQPPPPPKKEKTFHQFTTWTCSDVMSDGHKCSFSVWIALLCRPSAPALRRERNVRLSKYEACPVIDCLLDYCMKTWNADMRWYQLLSTFFASNFRQQSSSDLIWNNVIRTIPIRDHKSEVTGRR